MDPHGRIVRAEFLCGSRLHIRSVKAIHPFLQCRDSAVHLEEQYLRRYRRVWIGLLRLPALGFVNVEMGLGSGTFVVYAKSNYFLV